MVSVAKIDTSQHQTVIQASIVGWAGKKEPGLFSRTNAGLACFTVQACCYGSKRVPEWWISVNLYGRMAELAKELPLERVLIRATGHLWEVERGDGVGRWTRLKADTFAYKPKGQDWIEVKGEGKSSSDLSGSDILAKRLASGD